MADLTIQEIAVAVIVLFVLLIAIGIATGALDRILEFLSAGSVSELLKNLGLMK